MRKFSIFILIVLLASSCVVIKEYDKAHLNDSEMQLAAKNCERFETNFQVYREAASGANGGKSGGGCGCN
jgi:uncharacterized membrane protein